MKEEKKLSSFLPRSNPSNLSHDISVPSRRDVYKRYFTGRYIPAGALPVHVCICKPHDQYPHSSDICPIPVFRERSSLLPCIYKSVCSRPP